MQYHSTRGDAPVLGFSDVTLAGLARDGGLYVPTALPQLPSDVSDKWAQAGFRDIARAVLAPFCTPDLTIEQLTALIDDAYGSFHHAAVTPLSQLDDRLFLLELFHGPTLAFKDVALQLLGRLFDHLLTQQGCRATVIGATSGDTGSAAMAACAGQSAIDCFIFFPAGRVSEVQRRQMTTMAADNVHAIAIEGSFDDCQDLVKALFNDQAARDQLQLTAVNSINWARIVAQVIYYVLAAVRLGASATRRLRFAVPTGNFGNVYAGHVARGMGLPVNPFVIGSNRNDILTRLLETGTMSMEPVVSTLSPSMDIQISSNFERLLFSLMGDDGVQVAAAMQGFRATGQMALTADQHRTLTAGFRGARVDDDATMATIARVHGDTGVVLDPHTAVGVAAAALQPDPDAVTVALACAHPAKFPDAVERAMGRRPALPDHLADLLDRPERSTTLPKEYDIVRTHLANRSRVGR